MKATLNGKDYDLVIIDSNIVAQSLDQDLVFENGANLLETILIRQYEKHFGIDSWNTLTIRDYITNETDNQIEVFCQTHLPYAKIINNNLN